MKYKICLYCKSQIFHREVESHWNRRKYCNARCSGLAQIKPRTNTPEKFWEFVEKTSDCWIWNGVKDRKGYGVWCMRPRNQRAHRFSYMQLVGEIPDGLVIDHLCRNPACVNPAHLEPVTQSINNIRGFSPTALNAKKTHCKSGHLFEGYNLRIRPEGGRSCRACARDIARKRRAELKLASKVAGKQ